MTIASTDAKGAPWASTVAYAFDSKFRFYWVSVPESKHQQNIKHNSSIAFTIFDSHQQWGEGIGVQIEATVEQVSLLETPLAMETYFLRNYPYGNVIGSFGDALKKLLNGKVYNFYRATPNKVWFPDPDAEVDARVEVFLGGN